jgi:hypothetical protein
MGPAATSAAEPSRCGGDSRDSARRSGYGPHRRRAPRYRGTSSVAGHRMASARHSAAQGAGAASRRCISLVAGAPLAALAAAHARSDADRPRAGTPHGDGRHRDGLDTQVNRQLGRRDPVGPREQRLLQAVAIGGPVRPWGFRMLCSACPSRRQAPPGRCRSPTVDGILRPMTSPARDSEGRLGYVLAAVALVGVYFGLGRGTVAWLLACASAVVVLGVMAARHDRSHRQRGEAPHALWGMNDKNKPWGRRSR